MTIHLQPIFLTLLLTSAATMTHADVSTNENLHRPKVCLVLSGGGARGAAHIGVLKVLEEYRVPVDCVVGTSMGALVGGAYASGGSVAEMEQLTSTLSTQLLFKDKPPREELDIRRKQEDRTLLFSPELGVGSITGTNLPKGLVSGVQLESVLRKLAAPGYLDFDKLPIPYRAVATNLVTGKEKVFAKGELANVMRASMSVPVAITPVEIDGDLLVDGMLTNNMPVSVARSMGADVIIAVNVGTPLLKREKMDTIVGVAGQMLSILTEQNVQASIALLKPTDILITPELGDFDTGDFDHLPQTLPIGEAAARKASDQLLALSLSPQEYALYRQKASTITPQNLDPVDKIAFQNLRNVNPEFLESLMETKTSEPIDQSVLNHDLRILYGTSDFEQVNYRINDEAGERILLVNAAEKSWGPDYFRFGIGLNTDFQGNAEFTLEGRLRKTWLNSLGAESVNDIQIGATNRLATEFYQPITADHTYFTSLMAEIKQNSANLYENDDNIARYTLMRYGVGADMGVNFGTYGQLRVGVREGTLKPTLQIGLPNKALSDDTVAQGAIQSTLLLDKLDSATFPTDGWLAAANLYNSTTSLGASDNYTKWSSQATYVHTFGSNTFNLHAEAKDSFGGDLPYYDQHQLGGLFRQSGYQTGQFTGDSLQFGRLMFYNKLVDYTAFDGLYAGFSLEMGKIDSSLIQSTPTDTIYSGSAFLASDTPLGPLYFGYGQASGGSHSFYLLLGFPY